MTRRIPVFATLVVVAAAAVMVRLGFWQLDRAAERDEQLSRYISAPTLPPVTFSSGQNAETMLFRKASLDCVNPLFVKREGAGGQGTRYIFRCASGQWIQAGTSPDPNVRPLWSGGLVTGNVGRMPDHRTWLDAKLNPQATVLMLVADPPVGNLLPNVRPDPKDITNSSFGYAIQWFLFALTALVIYALALRKRMRS